MKKHEEIIEILQNNSICEDLIEEIIVKDSKKLIISLNMSKSGYNKVKFEELYKKSKVELENKLNFEKVIIILSEEKNLEQINKLAQMPKKESEQGAEAKAKQGFFGKTKEKAKKIFSKNNEKISNNDDKKGEKNKKSNEKSTFSGSGQIQPVIGVKKIIAVASAKGGVGKSTFAVNLASSLQKIGNNVALVDADIYGPSIPTMLKINKKPAVKDNLLLPEIAHNIKAISIGMMIDDKAAGVWRGPMITKILYQLIRSVDWQSDGKEVDYMIIDMPPGTGDVYLSLAQKFPLDGVVAISTPQMVAVKDVIRSIDCFEKLNIPILGLVQNMAYLQDENQEKRYIFGNDNAKKMAEQKKIKFLGDIPINERISQSTEDGTPYVVTHRADEISLSFGRICEDIIDQISDENAGQSLDRGRLQND